MDAQPAPSGSTNPNYATAANALIQQITEPTAVNVINVNVNVVKPTPTTNFVSEIQSMLYGFGDSRRPMLETAVLVNDIVRQQMIEILTRAIETSHQRGAGGTVGIEDIAFLMRKHPVKIQNLVRHLTIKDMANNTAITGSEALNANENRRAKRCKEFLMCIESEGGQIMQALNDELHDEIRTERLKRLDRLSRDLDDRRYSEFTRARQVSFLGHNMKFASKFQEWLLTGIRSFEPIIEEVDGQMFTSALSIDQKVKMDRSGLEGLAYLAYETVGTIVDMALLVRRDAEAGYSYEHGQGLDSFGMDPVMRHISPVSYNPQFPMVQQPLTATEDDHRRMLNSKDEDSVSTRPIQPCHVREVMRRLTQRPATFQLFSRLEGQRNNSNLIPLIAI